MTKDDSNSGSKPAEQADPLSATGMFLRAFDLETEGAKKPSDPFPPAPAPAAPPRSSSYGSDLPAFGDAPTRPVAPPAQPSGAGPGEFTQMFNALGPKPPAATPPPAREMPPQSVAQAAKSPSPAPADAAQGEFTRVFASGMTPANTPPAKTIQEPRPAPPAANPSRAKGFSSPGTSDSASAGSFTQFFNSTPSAAPPRSSAPVPSSMPPSPSNPPPAPDMSWKDDPIFKPAPKPSSTDQSSPSVTGILSSLASPGGSPTSRQPEPAAYRPDPLASYAPPKPAEPSASEPGGVTRLIKRLEQQQAAPPPPPPSAPAPPPASSGPGEFTRMMKGLGSNPAASAPPAAPPPQAASPAFPTFTPPPFTPPAPPPMPAAAPPHAAAPSPPVFAAPVLPPVPKPPAIALPPAPKSKLEAMVPILLVINTFLLLLLLMVVIFLIKSR
jgi:hypothetical protein